MNKTIIKGALICSFSVLSISAHSGSPNMEFLANRCDELSRAIRSLIDSQEKKSCIEKLGMASEQIMNTADSIRINATDEARQMLNSAVSALQYAELLSCNRYIQISHSKLEAYKIKKLL